MDIFFEQIKNFRYEKKFYVENITRQELEALLKQHPAIFREIYNQRRVNNIYLDTPQFRSYYESCDGVSKRVKFRIRWYRDTFGTIMEPALEVKLKHNHHVGKMSYRLNAFKVDESLNENDVLALIKNSEVPALIRLKLQGFNMKILNAYQRKYFLSSHGSFRVTLDWGMRVYRLRSNQNNFVYDHRQYNHAILEFKYNKESEHLAESLTQSLPFRVTRSSKYVRGLQDLYK